MNCSKENEYNFLFRYGSPIIALVTAFMMVHEGREIIANYYSNPDNPFQAMEFHFMDNKKDHLKDLYRLTLSKLDELFFDEISEVSVYSLIL